VKQWPISGHQKAPSSNQTRQESGKREKEKKKLIPSTLTPSPRRRLSCQERKREKQGPTSSLASHYK
jgi:DNA-binding TFAR19-related protein (PDSD5 family)